MGENKHIEELDAFAKKYVKEIPKEKTTNDFTTSVMQSILKESKSKVFATKALISKKGWAIISLFVLAVILIPFNGSEESAINFPEVNFSFLDKFQLPNLFESISISNTVLYSVFFFGLMIIAQVIFLKNHFEKRIE